MAMNSNDGRKQDWIAHAIRPMVPATDLVAVLDSWHKSHHGDPAYAWVPPGVHGSIYRAYVLHGLETGTWCVSIAHIDGEPDAIIGWCAAERECRSLRVVHYVYVKQLYRRMRVAMSLVMHALGDGIPSVVLASHMPRFVVPGIRVVYVPDAFFTSTALEWMDKKWAKKRKQLKGRSE